MNRFILVLFIAACSCNANQTATKETAPSNDTLTNKKNEPVPPPVPLAITAMENSGDLGQTTFTQAEKTVFFFNIKNNLGKVMLNGVEYSLNKYDFDSKTNTYTLSGDKVKINAPDCKFKKNEGEDCGYGKIAVATIILGADQLTLNNIDVQDCPNY